MPKRVPGGRTKRATKPRRAEAPLAASAAAPVEPFRPSPTATASAVAPARQSLLSTVRRPSRPAASAALSTDYHYVATDLRHIGILAGSAFVVLAALTFIIR